MQEKEILLELLLAGLWGGLVGLEREYRSKSAGFRTMIMISVGSCLFTILSVSLGKLTSPDRIASNIVTGIGFLGAGVIFHGTNRINGITTAAAIWAVAAVGMSIGAGHYYAAGYASVIILFVLSVLPWAEKKIDQWNQTRVYILTENWSTDKDDWLNKLFDSCSLRPQLTGQSREGTEITSTWSVQGSAKSHQAFVAHMLEENRVLRFAY